MILVKDYNTPPTENKKEFTSKLKFLMSNIKDKNLMSDEFKNSLQTSHEVGAKIKLVDRGRDSETDLVLVNFI